MITQIPTIMEAIGNTYIAKVNIPFSFLYELDSGANSREISFQSFVR